MHSFSRITIVACVALLLVGCRSVLEDKQIVQAELPRVEPPIVSEEQEAQLLA